jgi:hypothetical protein
MDTQSKPENGLSTFIAGQNTLAAIVLTATVTVILALFSSYNRPIWIDEFLQFAFAGFPSTIEAAATIHKTIAGVNMGQTGAYMLIDYGLLQLFGASAFWLRFPSLIGGVLLFAGAISFFRIRGFNVFWQLAAVLLLACQDHVMNFLGEARSYMPLTGAIVGLLAYYSAAPEQRTGYIAVLGWCSLVTGAIMHPYFAPYYALVLALTYADALDYQLSRISIRSLLSHVELPMFLASASLYAAVGAASWMLQPPLKLSFDPFQWAKREDLIPTGVMTHFQFLPMNGDPVSQRTLIAGLIGGTLLGLGLSVVNWKERRRVLSPLLLLLGAIFLTIFVSWMSYRANYWILGRQWIASIALACVAVVWFVATVVNFFAPRMRVIAVLASVAVLAYSIVQFRGAADRQLVRLAQWSTEQQRAAESPRLPRDEVPASAEDWVKLANQNIVQGGPVWSIFRRYYGG